MQTSETIGTFGLQERPETGKSFWLQPRKSESKQTATSVHTHALLCNPTVPRKLLPSQPVLLFIRYSFWFFKKLFSWKQNKKTSLTSYLLCNQDVSTLVCKTLEGGPWDDCKTPTCNPVRTADGDKSLHAGWHRQETIPHSSQYLIKKLTETVKWGVCTIICFCLLQYKLLWYLSCSQLPNTWR